MRQMAKKPQLYPSLLPSDSWGTAPGESCLTLQIRVGAAGVDVTETISLVQFGLREARRPGSGVLGLCYKLGLASLLSQ